MFLYDSNVYVCEKNKNGSDSHLAMKTKRLILKQMLDKCDKDEGRLREFNTEPSVG